MKKFLTILMFICIGSAHAQIRAQLQPHSPATPTPVAVICNHQVSYTCCRLGNGKSCNVKYQGTFQAMHVVNGQCVPNGSPVVSGYSNCNGGTEYSGVQCKGMFPRTSRMIGNLLSTGQQIQPNVTHPCF